MIFIKFNLNSLLKLPYSNKTGQIFLFIVMMLINTPFFCQDYQQIDASILMYPESFDSPEQLSKFISRDFVTEEEKVRAIYNWIILNISYDPDEYKQFNYNFKNYRERNEKEKKNT